MGFEYDPNKSAENKRKHGIDFDESQELWADFATGGDSGSYD